MRSIKLSKSGLNKARSNQFELKHNDFESSIKSIPPGEWILMGGENNELWFGSINAQIDEKFVCSYILKKISHAESSSVSAVDLILLRIDEAIAKRKLIRGYEKNSRLFFGTNDGVSGLIIDQFENGIIVQINVAGVDKFREQIRNHLEKQLERPCFLLDNPKYREKEFLPTFENLELPSISVIENDLKYFIRSEVLQKVGFYYDHRENRLQLMNYISRLKMEFEKGLDLFSYVGAWGASALKAGVKNVDFVDQGDFQIEVDKTLSENGFTQRGHFYRADVFKFLDDQISKKTQYDLILCDPPAFAKSLSQKNQALEGYTKLHRRVLKLLAPKAVVAFSSCTHYVSHEEFQKNIQQAAIKENRKIQLVYAGMQGFDHPVATLSDRSNYIKSYFYIVE